MNNVAVRTPALTSDSGFGPTDGCLGSAVSWRADRPVSPKAEGSNVILEGIVTTLNEDRTPNIAPMGPLVDERISQFVLRPYKTSTTFANLKRAGEGVLHVTDDVELLARAAVKQLNSVPKVAAANTVDGVVIADACRWYEFKVSSLDGQSERTTIACEVVARGRIRDFFGFNRAKHAVVEAAILASRLHLLPADEVCQEFRRLALLVDKTAGEQERRAFQFLNEYVGEALDL